MPNVLQAGAAWLGAQLQAYAGRAVRLQQGSTVIDGIVATVAEQRYEVLEESGAVTTFVAFDWTFVTDNLDVDGHVLTLRKGALITETINGVEQRYEATDIGDRRAAEWLDTSGVLLTLHTIKVP